MDAGPFAGWPMIRANLPTFFVIVVLIIGAVWWLMNWRYGSIIANRDSEIALLKGQRDDYKDKLSGATPDQAKNRVDDLERRIALLAKQVEPRSLTTDQRRLFSDNASVPSGEKYTVGLAVESSCTDCSIYADDMTQALRNVGWLVGNGVVMGPSRRPITGLALLVTNLQKLTPAETRLKGALEAANVPFNLFDGAREVPELLVVAIRPR
jgi:hypothetical protein